jgi:hypothetical protein
MVAGSPPGRQQGRGGTASLMPDQKCLRKCSSNLDLTVRLPVGIFATDGHDCFCAESEQAARLAGLERVECDGDCAYELVNPLDDVGGSNTCDKLLSSGIFSCHRDFCTDRCAAPSSLLFVGVCPRAGRFFVPCCSLKLHQQQVQLRGR